MSNLDNELNSIKEELTDMTKLVGMQLSKCKEALHNHDIELAREVIVNEKRVNATELKIDRDCEDFLALFNPVAVDLRFILASLKINTNLELMGDYAENIAKFLIKSDKAPGKDLLSRYKIDEMFDISTEMLDHALDALIYEDAKVARRVFGQDDELDKLYDKGWQLNIDLIREMPEQAENFLFIFSIISRLERFGDHTKNIAEEIIFYLEAKVLKHKSGKR